MLVCATLFWAGNFNVGKVAFLESIPPYTLAFLRWCLVWIILLPFTYKGNFKNKKKNFKKFTIIIFVRIYQCGCVYFIYLQCPELYSSN